MRNHWIKRGIGIAFAVIAGVFIFGFIVMHLWNWLMPELFGLKVITYCQAFGILILAKILFGGFMGKRGCGCGGHRGYWRSRWKEKWEAMSEEEREKIRQRCGDWCAPEEKK